ncbi:MAG: hypothetical protein VSS75_031970 [Candidatus Parabeggiatoa sp.]|nr:hypothetical protein [Candidatus Parabeggiatoa sp.]
MKKLRNAVVLILTLGFSVSSCPLLADTDTQSLQEEIDTLKTQLEALEQELDEVKKITQPVADTLDATTSDFSLNDADGLKLGGVLGLNYSYRDFADESETKFGDTGFDSLTLKLDAKHGDFSLSTSYMWFSYMDILYHGWVGYDFSKTSQLQVGVTQVPFGILPFASNNWWWGINHYLGLEGDHDFGVKWVYDPKPFNVQLAFFKNAEWGNPNKHERYFYDVVTQDEQANEETNQLNGRIAYTIEHGDLGSTEIGFSGEYGQLYNRLTDDTGDHWAGDIHLMGQYGRFNLKLELAKYKYDPKNPIGMSRETILMGGLGDAYPVASEGTVVVANVAYDVPINGSVVKSLTFYNDYGVLLKGEEGFEDSHLNITGCLIKTGPINTFVEFIAGKNMPYVGAPIESAFAAGNPEANWEKRFHINMSYHF